MIQVAIIGCGAVVEDLHVPPLRKFSRKGIIKIQALVDANPERTVRLGRYFPQARRLDSAEAAFTGGSISLTLIASPPALHLEHGLLALGAGSHLLVEKPMVPTAAGADRLCAAAARVGRVLAVGLPRRHFPHVAEVARLVAGGALGRPLAFDYREGAPYDWPVASEGAFMRERSGGGVLQDKGAHALDVLDALFGRAEVVRSADDSLTGGVESNSRLELHYPDANASGVVQLSWDQPLRNGLWIRGEKEELRLGLDDINCYHRREIGGEWRECLAASSWPGDIRKLPARRIPSGYLACIELEWIGVLRAILHGETPAATGTASARVIRVIESAYAGAEYLELPWLSAPERTVLRQRHWKAIP